MVPVDAKGRPYVQCRWRVQPGLDDKECGEFLVGAESAWDHILKTHLGIMKDEHGRLKIDPDGDERYSCHWGACRRFESERGTKSSWTIARHVQTHLPDTTSKAKERQKANRTDADVRRERAELTKRWFNTQVDERRDAAGLPLASVLVLRNLARQLAKVDAGSEAGVAEEMRMKMGGGGAPKVEREGLVMETFAPVLEQLYYVMAYNGSLGDYITSLMTAIAAGGG